MGLVRAPMAAANIIAMADLVAVGALGFLLAAIGLYFRRRELSRAFAICAALGVSLAIANLLIRMS